MNNIVFLFVALIAAIVGVFTYKTFNAPQMPEYALYYQQAREIKPFVLTDQNGKTFANQQLKNHWSFVFLGYTSCPDVCPTTLQELSNIYKELQTIASSSQVLFVTADPNRDSQAKLKQYIEYFNKAFFALRAEHDVLFPFTRNLGLMYAINDDGEHKDYLVDHSASIVLINPQGNIAAIFKPEQAAGKVPSVASEKMLSDFKKIVKLAQ
jgi:protein SCO1/2